jgi:carbamate kinase
MKKVVIALGGNALLESGEERTYEVQYRHAVKAFQSIASIIKHNQVVITHGNGQQVGDIILSHELSKIEASIHQCGAMSQGSIAEILLNAYDYVNAKMWINKEAVAIFSRVVVDEKDPAFANPMKPVGRVYNEGELGTLKRKGWTVRKTDEGWRRVVPSPAPKEIIELQAIKSLLHSGHVPIAVGGGGVPVVRRGGRLSGVEAVIDKDLTSSLLATELGADVLMLLTNVPYAYIDYKKPTQRKIVKVDVGTMEHYLKLGQFEEGSMEPKVIAAINFIKHGGKEAIITSLDKAYPAFKLKYGTIIKRAV